MLNCKANTYTNLFNNLYLMNSVSDQGCAEFELLRLSCLQSLYNHEGKEGKKGLPDDLA
jgi:hypothetical protein